MPTASRDPIPRDTHDAPTDAPRERRDEATEEDVVPPLDVLVAAHDQDRKETEDLLAGFDKRRGPKRQSRARDFVDYYAKRGEEDDEKERADEPPKRAVTRDVATVVLGHAKKKRTPGWLPWVGVGAVMIAVGASVGFFATRDAPAPKPAATAATVATATTTTATPTTATPSAAPSSTGSAPPVATAAPRASIPAPRASTTGRPSKAREPAPATTPTTAPSGEDFYRGL